MLTIDSVRFLGSQSFTQSHSQTVTRKHKGNPFLANCGYRRIPGGKNSLMKIKVIARLILYRCITCYVATGGLLSKWKKKGVQFFNAFSFGRETQPTKFSTLLVAFEIFTTVGRRNSSSLDLSERLDARVSRKLSFGKELIREFRTNVRRLWENLAFEYLPFWSARRKPHNVHLLAQHDFRRFRADLADAHRRSPSRRNSPVKRHATSSNGTKAQKRFDWILLNETYNTHCFL